MERKIAERLMNEMLALGRHLDQAGELTKQMVDAEERVAFRKGIGEVVGSVYTEVMIPLIRQYPDLDPDRESGPDAVPE